MCMKFIEVATCVIADYQLFCCLHWTKPTKQ